MAPRCADCPGFDAGRDRRDVDRLEGEPVVAEVVDVCDSAAVDSDSGCGISPADPFRTVDRIAVWIGPWCLIFGHNDFRAAAGADAEQSGLRQTGVPRRARADPAGGVHIYGDCLFDDGIDHDDIADVDTANSA